MPVKEKKHIIETYKNVIDEFFRDIDQVNDKNAQRNTWKKLSLLVARTDNPDAAEALYKTLTISRLRTIRNSALVDDAEIIDSALEIHTSLLRAHNHHKKFLQHKDVSLEKYADRNTFRATKDRDARLKEEMRRVAGEPKPARKKKVSGGKSISMRAKPRI